MQTVTVENLLFLTQPKISHLGPELTKHEKDIMESNLSLFSNKWKPEISEVKYQADINHDKQGKTGEILSKIR